MKASKWIVQSIVLAVVSGLANAQMIIIGDPPDWVGHGPPPPGWEARDTANTQYVLGPKVGRLGIPRKADGTCTQVSMVAKPGRTSDSLDDFSGDIDFSKPNDGSCDIIIERVRIKRRPFDKARVKRLIPGMRDLPTSAPGARSRPEFGSTETIRSE